MTIGEIIIGVAVLVTSLIIIAVVLLQEGRKAGISGVISGGAETFLSKNKARTFEAFLGKWTKVIAVLFFVLVIVANVIAVNAK